MKEKFKKGTLEMGTFLRKIKKYNTKLITELRNLFGAGDRQLSKFLKKQFELKI
ncbi:MAG: hypothetical protein DSM106950_01605 [Stigonema ocellatum SAG 48.90 = DSM 106950]|nr:hypothetical protein [Stigonema ocellatum SAG 48.90 = DSM 106950]